MAWNEVKGLVLNMKLIFPHNQSFILLTTFYGSLLLLLTDNAHTKVSFAA